MGSVAEQHRRRGAGSRDLQELDLVVDRRVAPGGDEVAGARAELDPRWPLLVGDRVLDEAEHLVGQPAPVGEVTRIDLDRRVVVVRGQQDQVRRRREEQEERHGHRRDPPRTAGFGYKFGYIARIGV